MMWSEIKLLPRYDVKPPAGPLAHTPARAKATSDRAATWKRAKAKAGIIEKKQVKERNDGR